MCGWKMKQLRKDEIKEIAVKVGGYGISISKKDKVVLDDDIIKVNGTAKLFYLENEIVPLIKSEPTLKKVTVDMGAIKFVTSGADIMRPGITKMDDFDKDELIAIVDETHGKTLAVGKALLSSEDMRQMEGGKAVANLHHVGDRIWQEF